MNRYMIICRLRWPAFLLLTGIIALLSQVHVLSWGHAWPLYLILFGVLALAERATLASQPQPDGYSYGAGYQPGYQAGYQPGYPAGSYPPQPGPYAGAAPVPPAAPSTSIVPAHDNLEMQSSKPFTGTDEEGR